MRAMEALQDGFQQLGIVVNLSFMSSMLIRGALAEKEIVRFYWFRRSFFRFERNSAGMLY